MALALRPGGTRPGKLGLGFGAAWARRWSSTAEEESVQLPEKAGGSGSGGSVGPRFYKHARMRPSDDGHYVVMLDRFTLKTPKKNPVSVPTPGLALAIAAEWEWQTKSGIRPFTMPLMKLAATTIDRLPDFRENVIENLLKYSHADSVYCRAPETEPLSHKQAQQWDPLVKWIEGKIGAKPSVTSSILIGKQPKEVLDAYKKILGDFNNWELSAVDQLTASARSLVIALAIIDGRLDVEKAMKAIRVDEDFQIAKWGLVEGGHDIDISDLRVRITAASIFHRLLQM
ncbi:hypothetical protein SELMODRAFT_187108 [Selaginella moellendorffii]|uniref:ATP synthase mitochondrial F1 complex assembly factor 2 n=1 Tax=Selaginella moellendorffii TaxID=88036 RepID=D8TBE8_SELML|nr:ATP synthase mitochondrial F1 complex assembly factor 2 [Selaginella moellendorffii]EFJ06001.1 hypothetical protein SELMODRAFT_187108 [Selaginella moellendorffii]|eukprot:XP_002992912.1 ATP synthase mitochondrial F1 complex assembly factor 2 [Selaginella moellendorffii]